MRLNVNGHVLNRAANKIVSFDARATVLFRRWICGGYNLESIFELNSHMCMQNIFNGVIWFVLPVLLVAANDTFAYICGFFIGKKYIQVPLISLSVSHYL